MATFAPARTDELREALEGGQTRVEEFEKHGLLEDPAFTLLLRKGELKVTPVGNHVNIQLVEE